MVPQLHVHHIVRYKNDIAWPNPVWGYVAAIEYSPDRLEEVCESVRDILLEQFQALY